MLRLLVRRRLPQAGHDANAQRRCGSCAYFLGITPQLECALPGLSTLGSGYASVRSDDGICLWHDCLCGVQHTCQQYQARSQAHPRTVSAACGG